MSKILHYGSLQVKPVFSTNATEARRNVLRLYKIYYRELPLLVQMYNMPVTLNQARKELRKRFQKNNQVRDVRVIDNLVFKGQLELVEMANVWKQKHHMMAYFEDPTFPKPHQDFLSKFYRGANA